MPNYLYLFIAAIALLCMRLVFHIRLVREEKKKAREYASIAMGEAQECCRDAEKMFELFERNLPQDFSRKSEIIFAFRNAKHQLPKLISFFYSVNPSIEACRWIEDECNELTLIIRRMRAEGEKELFPSEGGVYEVNSSGKLEKNESP
ncbi:MAG: hypothetical protein WCW78_02470 [Candidatus Paceibacterota bacterium]|jgi:hypothetical protein